MTRKMKHSGMSDILWLVVTEISVCDCIAYSYTANVCHDKLYYGLDNFGAWDISGCREIQVSEGRIVCECTQLGHFGILFVSFIRTQLHVSSAMR